MAIYTKLHKRTGKLWWYARVVGPDGRRIKVKAGTTKKQAIKRENILVGQIAAGEYVDKRKEAAESITFGAFLDRFIEDRGHECRSNYYQERAKVLRAHFGDRLLASITQDDLDAFRRAREAGTIKGFRAAGDSTVKKDMTVLVTLFRFALRRKILTVDPTFDLRKPKEPKATARAFTLDEYQKIRGASPQWMRPIVRFALVTGLSLEDVAGLRWDDLDLAAAKMDLLRGKTKTPLSIPIGTVAAAVLEDTGTRFRGGNVFQDSEGTPYTSERARNKISQHFVALLVGLKIRRRGGGRALEGGPSFKTLRTTAATWASKAGHPDAHVSFLLGHSRSATMTSRYIDLTADDLRPIMRSLDSAESGSVPWPAPQVDRGDGSGSGDGRNLNAVSGSQSVGT